MHKILAIIFFLILKLTSFGQIDNLVQFTKGMVPEWTHISYDSNFFNYSNGIDNSTPFSKIFFIDGVYINGAVNILEMTTSLSPGSGRDGYILRNLDIDSGKPNWVHHHNYYTGSKHREEVFNVRLHVNEEEGTVSVFTIRDTMIIDTNRSRFNFYGVPVIRRFDNDSGSQLEEHVLDTSFNQYFFSTRMPRGHDDRHAYVADVKFFTRDSFIQHGVYFYHGSTTLDSPLTLIDSIIWNTDDKGDFFYAASVPTYDYIKNREFATVFVKNDTNYDTVGNYEMRLFKSRFNEDGTVTKQSKDVSDELNIADNVPNPIEVFTVGDQTLLYTVEYYDFPLYREWISWYDAVLNHVSRLDTLKYNGRLYNWFLPVQYHEGNMYYFGRGQRTDTYEDYTLFRWNGASGALDSLGSIIIDHFGTNTYNGMNFRLLKDSKMLMSARFNGSNTAYMIHALFDLSKFGITSIAEKEIAKSEEIIIYPNPVGSILHLQGMSEMSNTHIEIFDATGMLSMKSEVHGAISSLDVSALPSGMYVLKIIDSSHDKISNLQFVKM